MKVYAIVPPEVYRVGMRRTIVSKKKKERECNDWISRLRLARRVIVEYSTGSTELLLHCQGPVGPDHVEKRQEKRHQSSASKRINEHSEVV
jgi:hypothetical protein